MFLKVPFLLLALALFAVLNVNGVGGSAVLISDTAMTVMVELSSRHPFCKMHTDRGDIQRMLLQSDPRRIRQVPRESVMELEEVCKKAGSYGREFRGGLGFIYPGTKWCGPGTVAVDFNDLGYHAAEDRCCREHDLCPNVLNAGECRRGLCNTGTFTRSHCDCDARLRRCLQSLNTETANTLGAIFYNVVQVTCFQERSPCSTHQRFENVLYRTNHCNIEFRTADLYVPPNPGNLIQRILTYPYGFEAKFVPSAGLNDGRFLSQVPGPIVQSVFAAKQNIDHFKRRLGVKLASIGLAAVNIVREIFRSPGDVWDSLSAALRQQPAGTTQANHVPGSYYSFTSPAHQQPPYGGHSHYHYRHPATSKNSWNYYSQPSPNRPF